MAGYKWYLTLHAVLPVHCALRRQVNVNVTVHVTVITWCQVRGQRAQFEVLLTSYELLMSDSDAPRLAALPWAHLIVDEGHRLKNAACKLNAVLCQYSARHRLLLTGAAATFVFAAQSSWTLQCCQTMHLLDC